MDTNDLNLEGQVDAQIAEEEKLKTKNRFDKLSEKVILTTKEKEAEAEARKKAEGERDVLSKERDFYKEFSANISKYPNAAEYQDQILEKVKLGYTPEDAMVSVLAKEGKLGGQAPKPSPQVEGGSASTTLEGGKSIQDMTATEKFEALKEADQRGDLANALRGR